MPRHKRLIYRSPDTGQMIELYQNSEIVGSAPTQYPEITHIPEIPWPHPPVMPPMSQPMVYGQQQYAPAQYTHQGREKGAQLAGMIVFAYLGFWVCAAASPVITILGWAGLSGFLLYRAVKSFA